MHQRAGVSATELIVRNLFTTWGEAIEVPVGWIRQAHISVTQLMI